jgi:hypothetical protein
LRRLLAFALGSSLLAGCGVTTYQQVYSPELIKQVGAGSLAEAQLLPTIQAQTKTGLFSDPATSQATDYLLEGQLNKLSESDLVRIATANRNAASAGGVVTSFSKLRSAIAAATVDGTSFTGLADCSKTFIAKWDGYLATTAKALENVQSAVSGMSPIYRELPGLMRAARDTARLRSTVLCRHTVGGGGVSLLGLGELLICKRACHEPHTRTPFYSCCAKPTSTCPHPTGPIAGRGRKARHS